MKDFENYIYREYLTSRLNLKIRADVDNSIKIKDKLKKCLTGEQYNLVEKFDQVLTNLHAEEIKFVINLVAKMYKSIYK